MKCWSVRPIIPVAKLRWHNAYLDPTDLNDGNDCNIDDDNDDDGDDNGDNCKNALETGACKVLSCKLDTACMA